MNRRTFLTTTAAIAAVGLVGCIGGDSGGDAPADPAGSQTPNSSPTQAGSADGCGGIEGDFAPYDPGDRSFPFLFEIPETFEEYNQEINEAESLIGAQFGHRETGGASYPINLAIYEHKVPNDDEESLENWVTSFDLAAPIDWSFTFDGAAVTVYEFEDDDAESTVWQFLLPAEDDAGYYGIRVLFQDDEYDGTCMPVMTELAKELIRSLERNPAY